jgi:arginine/lysine/ornithine decarboxylase
MKNAPLFEALIQHTKKNKWSFHVPGHKNGQLFEKEGLAYFQSALPFDLTELNGLDDLHHADGVIKEAQEKLSSFYKVKKSYFLVGGSTSGNLAMILSSFDEGDIVFVQRNCHKSVLNGLELAGVTPVFLSPEVDEAAGFTLGVSVETVREAAHKFPELKGIILTTPTYYGMQQEIKEIAEIIHEYGGVVLVDEAHGAHFNLNDMPISAIHQGADIVVQSAHKTLPALTMGAYLHVNSDRIENYRLTHALQMVQSSSPSYLIMASLDLSRLFMENLKDIEIEAIISQSIDFRHYIDSLPYLSSVKASAGYILDPLKVTIQSDREISGYEMQRLLEEEGVFTELADERNVLLVLPLGQIHSLIELKAVFLNLSNELASYESRTSSESASIYFPSVSQLNEPYSSMKRMRTQRMMIGEAAGKVAAEAIIPYPPGIPLIAKGEKITAESIRHYFALKTKGANIQGINENHEMYVFDIK